MEVYVFWMRFFIEVEGTYFIAGLTYKKYGLR